MNDAEVVQGEEQLPFQVADGGAVPTSPLQLVVRLVRKPTASNFYRKWHYLGDKGFLATYNYGAYYGGRIVGAVSFGPPSAEETVKGIFGTPDQNGYWEIKRLAMDDGCPKNSESRFIAVSLRLLRRATAVLGVVTYADTAQGHSGTIYKASGFEYRGLTAAKKDFWVDGKIQERGKTRGLDGEWRPRSRKHLFVKRFECGGLE